MHKLYEYACDELKELEKKADKGLSAAEIEYAAKLTELKKNILKIEMLEEDSEYSEEGRGGSYRGSYRGGNQGGGSNQGGNRGGGSNRGGSYEGGSYARGRGRNARRDSMGRYSSEEYSMAADDVIEQLEGMMDTAPDEKSRKKIRELISEMQNV